MNSAWKAGRITPGWPCLCGAAEMLRGARRGGGEADVIAGELLQKRGELPPMALFVWQRLNDTLCLQRDPLGPCVAFSVPACHHASAAPWIPAACCCLCLASLAGRWSLTRRSWCLSRFCCSCTFLFRPACRLWRRTSQGYSGTPTFWTSASHALSYSLLSIFLSNRWTRID